MPRPKNADPERTRRELLAAGIRWFGERGYEGTSLRRVGADASVTFGTVHHYFGNKAGLYAACLEASYEELGSFRGELASILANAATVPKETTVRELAALSYRHARDRAEVTRFLLRAVLFERHVAEEQDDIIDDAHRDYLAAASQILGMALGRDAGALRVPVQGMLFLITRAAVMSDAERAGLAADDAAIERYLGDVAVATLL